MGECFDWDPEEFLIIFLHFDHFTVKKRNPQPPFFFRVCLLPLALHARFSQSLAHSGCALRLYHGEAGDGSGFAPWGLSASLGTILCFKIRGVTVLSSGSCVVYAHGVYRCAPVPYKIGSATVADPVC